MADTKIVEKHPLAVRWFHWVNFPIIFVMIWSGMMIYWANSVYKIGWNKWVVVYLFPKSFYSFFNLSGKLATGMSFHFAFMWIFVFNGLLYFTYLLYSRQYKYIFPTKKSFKEAGQVILHDLKLSKTVPAHSKYNAAQRIAYTVLLSWDS